MNKKKIEFISLDDFIDVPIVPKSTEPILLPSDDSLETSINNNNNNNTSSEFIELDNEDESSHNSTAIEDIQMLIDNDKDSSISQSLDQLQAELIDDTAAQLNTARGNERLTTTLTDTMHEDTQVIKIYLSLKISCFLLF